MAYIHIAGRLGGDPESRFTAGGKKVTTFNVAENLRGADGSDQAVWYRVVLWGDRFDKMVSHLKKGSAVYAIGEHRPSKWKDNQGQERVTEEVWAVELRFGPLPPTKQEKTEGGDFEHKAAPQQQPLQSSGGFSPQQTPVGSMQAAPGQGHYDEMEDEDLPF